MKKIILIFFSLLLSCNQDKSLSFSSLFKNHMVLQQDEYVSVWGHAKPGSQITLESDWGEKKIITTKENGEWKTQIKTLKADFKPHELSIKSWANKIIIKDILFGEVWFASGQSNMGWQMGNKIT